MKKIILGLSVAAFASFGSAIAEEYDLGAACEAAVAENPLMTDDQKSDGCSCLVDAADGDEATIAGFKAGGEAAEGLEGEAADAAAREHWTAEGTAMVDDQCFAEAIAAAEAAAAAAAE